MKYIKDFLCGGFKNNISAAGPLKFTWRITGAKTQESYRLTIKKSGGKIVYDSGNIESALTFVTAHPQLEREKDYIATLSIKTELGASEARLSFRTEAVENLGSAKWIGRSESEKPYLGGAPATYFKKEFEFSKGRAKAYLYIAGLGLFNVYINGKKVGVGVLNSPFLDYNKGVFYETYEVSALLNNGHNIITVVVGDGWSCQNTVDTWGFFKANFKCEHKMILRLVSKGLEINSDESFKVSEDGEITRSALRLGEYYDARRKPTYSEFAVIKEAPRGKLLANNMHLIKEMKSYRYKTVEKLADGYLLDFGVNIAGYASVNISGSSAEHIKLVYGDRLENGDISNVSNAQYIMDSSQNETYQTDMVTLSDGCVSFKPQFVYHGFRYIKVIGLSSPPTHGEIVAVSIRTSFKKIGEFKSSSRIINTLYDMCCASQEANFVGIPTDCPHREKNGWTGDLQLSLEQLLYNYDCEIDLHKFENDICKTQRDGGEISCIAPTDSNIFGYDWGPGPAWDVAMFLTPFEIAKRTGDFESARKYIPFMKKYSDYLETRRESDGLVEFGLGDWNPPRACSVTEAPLKLIASLYYKNMNDILAYLCEKLGENGTVYSKRAKKMHELIRRKYVKRSGLVAEGGACAQAAAIYFGVVDGALKDKVFKVLLKTLKRDKYTMRFGIMGSKYIFHTLCELGRCDIALKMLKQSDYPSFANWIKRGAVTLWEDYEGTNSRNHYMYSDIVAVFFKYFAGIDYEAISGIQRNIIRINRVYGERFVSAHTMTPAGNLEITQVRNDEKIKISVVLPPNSVSEIVFENGDRVALLESGEYTFDLLSR